MAFWRRLLAGSDWSNLLTLLSPSLFDVVSARDLSKRTAELAHNWFDRPRYLACVERLRAALQTHDIAVDVVSCKPSRSVVPFRADPWPDDACPVACDGDAVLRFFFLQIAVTNTVFLDLRSARFCRCPRTAQVTYHPLPLWTEWHPEFARAIRLLYEGFYTEQAALFESALQTLGLTVARDIFERAFGGDRLRASRYSMAEFRDTFHQVFVRCRDSGVALHPDFVTLGIMLATLYDHLDSIGGVYDVQSAYRAAMDAARRGAATQAQSA